MDLDCVLVNSGGDFWHPLIEILMLRQRVILDDKFNLQFFASFVFICRALLF
jgi:hypothetical protein